MSPLYVEKLCSSSVQSTASDFLLPSESFDLELVPEDSIYIAENPRWCHKMFNISIRFASNFRKKQVTLSHNINHTSSRLAEQKRLEQKIERIVVLTATTYAT
jgi:hypothetical protein